jgi:tetratricopeptide (TPR) repeat protein
VYYEKGDYDNAIRDYDRVMKIKPNLTYVVLNNRGLVYVEKNKAFD